MNLKVKMLYMILVLCTIVSSISAQEILDASKNGDLKKIILLFEKDSSSINEEDRAGRTALHFSANSGHLDIVKFLLDQGFDVNVKTKAGTTPLHYAALRGQLEIVKVLIENNAELEIKNNQTVTPLYYAAMQGQLETVKFLLSRGAFVDAYDFEKGTPLHSAAQSGHVDMVKLLIANKANKKAMDTNGRTAIHFAAMNGNVELIGLLIDGGLNANEPDLYGKNPLYYAVAAGHGKAVEQFWNNGIYDINEACSDGNTYLHAAAVSGLTQFCEKLITNEAAINMENIYGATPLDLAIRNEKKEIINMLIAHGGKKRSVKNTVLEGNYLGQKPPGMKPLLFAPGIISTDGVNERDVSFSTDGKEFFFTRRVEGKPFDIMYMKQDKDGWSNAVRANFSSRFNDAEAYFTPDENRIYFISNRPPNGGENPSSWEIWYVKRVENSWSTAVLLGPPFESGFYPTFTQNWKMYYTQNGDIYRAQYADGIFHKPQKLDANVNTNEQEYNSFVSGKEDFLIFTADREDSYGNGDLYICFRNADDNWSQAINMGPEINSFARDYCPSVSPDGKYFFFSSRRYGAENIFWVDARIIEKLRPAKF